MKDPEDELAGWDAVETASRIRRKEISAGEVVDRAIRRAEEVAHLGAVVTPAFEEARAAAHSGGEGAFGGVPTFIKDLAHVRGTRTTWGSRASGHYIARKTDTFVANFLSTGVISLGKSASPELGLTATTEPLGRPPCRNPWDPSRSAGGSSGGAASLVASGVVPIAHASDGGGSIRIPAACCGLVGLKPSRFRIDMEGSNLLPINIATDGVVTRTVRDTIAFYEALESRRRPKKVPPVSDGRATNKALRIGLYVDAPIGTKVHAETQDAVVNAGRLCESLGHRVDSIRCPFEGSVIDDFLAFWGFVAWIQKSTAKIMLHRGFDATRLEPWTNGIAGTFTARPKAAFDAIMRLRGFSRTYRRIMDAYDVLVGPTTAEPAVALGYLAPDQPFETAFERLRSYCAFTPIQNAAGAPAISLPLGKSTTGLPIGVHFAGAHGADRTLLDLAEAIERAAPWPKTAPRSHFS